MSTLSKKNPIVLRIEHGHPGYVDHQVIATRDSLRSFIVGVLAKIDAIPEKTDTIESVECTLAHERSDHVYVSFHVASKENVERYHTRLPLIRASKALRSFYHLAAFFLAIYGLYRLFGG